MQEFDKEKEFRLTKLNLNEDKSNQFLSIDFHSDVQSQADTDSARSANSQAVPTSILKQKDLTNPRSSRKVRFWDQEMVYLNKRFNLM